MASKQSKRAWYAAGQLAGALLLAVGARRLFEIGELGASLAMAAASLALCGGVLRLTAPGAVRWVGEKLPWGAPVTRAGAVYIGFALLVGGAAIYSGNNLIYLVLSAMLSAMLASGLVSRLGLAGLQLLWRLPEHVFAGEPTTARVGVRNLKRWMPSFSLTLESVADSSDAYQMETLYFPMVAPGGEARSSAEIRFKRRGRVDEVALRLRSSFPFGLVEREERVPVRRELLVYPSIEPTEQSESIVARLEQELAGAVGDSHDLYRVRPATPDDDARHVHWKASARDGSLWVKEYHREERREVTLGLERTANSEAEFDARVRICAAALWSLNEKRADVTLRTDEVEIRCPAGSAEVYRALAYLALVERGSTGRGLGLEEDESAVVLG